MDKTEQAEIAELAERVHARAYEWHLTPREHLLMRINARLRGLEVGDAFAAWQNFRRFHSRCAICKAG